MKNLTTLLLLGFGMLMVSCKKENSQVSLVGKWQLTETYFSSGGPGSWHPVTDKRSAELIEFTVNGTYKNNGLTLFDHYELTDSVTLVLSSSINTFRSKYVYRYKIQNRSLILSPISPNACYEECASKYNKIID